MNLLSRRSLQTDDYISADYADRTEDDRYIGAARLLLLAAHRALTGALASRDTAACVRPRDSRYARHAVARRAQRSSRSTCWSTDGRARRRATPTTTSTCGSITRRARSPAAGSSAGATSATCRPTRCGSTCTGMAGATRSRRGCAKRRLPAKRRATCAAEDWSSIDVLQLAIANRDGTAGLDLLPGFTFVQPDDGNPRDRTLAAVALPAAVAPGEEIALRVRWKAHVPRTFARTGAIGNYYFIAQWFPKVAVFEDDRWIAHQFHANTEFFSDYGRYDVRMTVPRRLDRRRHRTGARRTDNADGTTTHRYVQDDVHDFAWTTSPSYVEHRQTFSHASLPSVEMRLLLQPEHAGQEDRHFAATAAALRYYGEWYGPYPYGHITIVDPAYQSGAGGMEYPTLFTAGTRWLAPRQSNTPESVTVHEAGHQFWYGMVGNNEFEHAWLDEGLNTFSEERVLWTTVSAQLPRRALLRRLHPVAVPRYPAQARDRRQPRRALSPGSRERRSVNADVALLAGDALGHQLQQDGAVAAHARTASGMGDAAAHPVHLLRALEVPPSAPRRLLRRRQRGQRARPDLVLRPGAPQLERVRLRRRHADQREGPRDCRRAPSGRSDLSRRRRDHLRRRRSRSPSAGTAVTGGARTPTRTAAALSARLSIPIGCCCSTSTTRTTAAPRNRAGKARRSSGRSRGWCGCRTCC